MKFNFFLKNFYLLLIGILIASCSFDSLIDSSDYRILIRDTFGTRDLGSGTFEYGFTLENQGIVAATQLDITIRFSFSDGSTTGSINRVERYTQTLDVGELVVIESSFSDSEAGSFSISDLTGVRVTSVRFFNIEESADSLFENTYEGSEGVIPVNN